MYSLTWNCEVDDWAKFAVCLNSDPPDPLSWFETRAEAEEELSEFDEDDRTELIILPVE